VSKHKITEEEYAEVKELAKANKLKRVDKRLQVLMLRYEGESDAEIAKRLGYHKKYVGQMRADFKRKGLAEYAKHKYGGNNQVVETAKEAGERGGDIRKV
jgi:transposase